MQREFIVSMHVFPGLNQFGHNSAFWHQNDTDTFLAILNKYQDQITLVTASHIHNFEFRIPKDSRFPDLRVPFMITPSISPLHLNNPSYTTLDLAPRKGRTSAIDDVNVHSFQLQYYIAAGAYHWTTFNPTKDAGYDFNYENHVKPTHYNKANDWMTYSSPKEYGLAQGYSNGFDLYARGYISSELFAPLYMENYDSQHSVSMICGLMYFNPNDKGLIDCLNQKPH